MPTLRILYIECITTGTGLFWKENDKAFSKFLGKILDAQNRLLGTAGAVTGFTPLNVLKDAINAAGDVWKEVTDLIESLGLDGSDDFYISLSDQEGQQKIWPLQEDYFELGDERPRITLDLPIPYDRTITVYFWERDTGSDDDILGSLSVISHELAGREGEPDTATGIFVGSKQENSLYYIVFSGGVALNSDGKPSPLGTSAAALSKAKTSVIAANPRDKWVLTMGNRVLVITNDGGGFAHDIVDNQIGAPFQLGTGVAANPQDKWVLTMGNRILVIVNDGRVFAHDIVDNQIGAPFQLGAGVAANPQDKWVLTMGNRILVIVNDGRVFAHDIVDNQIGAPFQLS